MVSLYTRTRNGLVSSTTDAFAFLNGKYFSGSAFGYLVAIVQDPRAAGMSLPEGSFGWLGGYGSQVWINPKAQLVTILMIQNMVSEVQRDVEAAAMQARLNEINVDWEGDGDSNFLQGDSLGAGCGPRGRSDRFFPDALAHHSGRQRRMGRSAVRGWGPLLAHRAGQSAAH